jgi:hypothetical protein
MEGTEQEDDWCFYHDALSLMTAKEMILWMKAKKNYKWWILPEWAFMSWRKFSS